jgi:hypothetical protein
MKNLAILAGIALFAAAAPAFAKKPAPEPAAAETPAYEPMAMFAPFSGKTFRGEWTDEKGEHLVDISKYEIILNGRALQSTHRLEGKDYGGRTIFFYDEGAKNYVFHYFTTAGFHTTGVSQFVDGGLVTDEKVEGHAKVASVRSKVIFGDKDVLIDVVYVGKDGSETPGGHRVYKEIADPGRLFPDTE